jgi:hypothetical protein
VIIGLTTRALLHEACFIQFYILYFKFYMLYLIVYIYIILHVIIYVWHTMDKFYIQPYWVIIGSMKCIINNNNNIVKLLVMFLREFCTLQATNSWVLSLALSLSLFLVTNEWTTTNLYCHQTVLDNTDFFIVNAI